MPVWLRVIQLYNNKTGSNGTVKINRSYAHVSLICKEYESNFNIKQAWQLLYCNQDINTRFGVVCQMPDAPLGREA